MLWILYNFCPILHKGVHHCRATLVFPTPYIKPVLRLVTRPRCLSLPPWCEVLLWSTNTESLVMLALLESPSKLSSGWLTTYPQTSYSESSSTADSPLYTTCLTTSSTSIQTLPLLFDAHQLLRSRMAVHRGMATTVLSTQAPWKNSPSLFAYRPPWT